LAAHRQFVLEVQNILRPADKRQTHDVRMLGDEVEVAPIFLRHRTNA